MKFVTFFSYFDNIILRFCKIAGIAFPGKRIEGANRIVNTVTSCDSCVSRRDLRRKTSLHGFQHLLAKKQRYRHLFPIKSIKIRKIPRSVTLFSGGDNQQSLTSCPRLLARNSAADFSNLGTSHSLNYSDTACSCNTFNISPPQQS